MNPRNDAGKLLTYARTFVYHVSIRYVTDVPEHERRNDMRAIDDAVLAECEGCGDDVPVAEIDDNGFCQACAVEIAA